MREACMDQYTAVEDQLAPPSECNPLKPAAVEVQRAMDAVAIANTLKPYQFSRKLPWVDGAQVISAIADHVVPIPTLSYWAHPTQTGSCSLMRS